MGRNKKKVIIESGGLGTIIENVIKSTGLNKFVDGKDCGCDERKEKLNKLFPMRFKARCFTEDEYIGWKAFQEVRTLKISSAQVDYICNLYASVFSKPIYKPCVNCSPKPLIDMIDKLDQVYETYNQ